LNLVIHLELKACRLNFDALSHLIEVAEEILRYLFSPHTTTTTTPINIKQSSTTEASKTLELPTNIPKNIFIHITYIVMNEQDINTYELLRIVLVKQLSRVGITRKM
jgi:hypothetical protein